MYDIFIKDYSIILILYYISLFCVMFKEIILFIYHILYYIATVCHFLYHYPINWSGRLTVTIDAHDSSWTAENLARWKRTLSLDPSTCHSSVDLGIVADHCVEWRLEVLGFRGKFSNFLWDKPHLKACFIWFQRMSWHYHCNFVWSKVCQFRLGFQKGQWRYRRISTACPGFRVKSRMSWSKSPSSTIVQKKNRKVSILLVADTKAIWLRIPFWKLFLWGWLSFIEIYWFWSVIEFAFEVFCQHSWRVEQLWWAKRGLCQRAVGPD